MKKIDDFLAHLMRNGKVVVAERFIERFIMRCKSSGLKVTEGKTNRYASGLRKSLEFFL